MGLICEGNVRIFLFKALIICPLATAYITSAAASCLTDKYIFDIGSGGIRSTGYSVDICKGLIHKKIAENYYNMPLQEYISNSHDGRTIPDSYVKKGRDAFIHLKHQFGIDCVKERCLAVATAWARNATNSSQLIEEIKKEGIDTYVISQQDEGKISFDSLAKDNNLTDFEKRNTIVFDIGGGSFQLNYMSEQGKIMVYNGPYGMFNFKKLILAKFSENGVLSSSALDMVKEFALKEIGSKLESHTELYNKLLNKNLLVLGTGAFMGSCIKQQLGLGGYVSLSGVEKALADIFGKSVVEIQKIYPNMPEEHTVNAQFSLLIVYAIMKEGGIKAITIPHNVHVNEYLALNGLSNIN